MFFWTSGRPPDLPCTAQPLQTGCPRIVPATWSGQPGKHLKQAKNICKVFSSDAANSQRKVLLEKCPGFIEKAHSHQLVFLAGMKLSNWRPNSGCLKTDKWLTRGCVWPRPSVFSDHKTMSGVSFVITTRPTVIVSLTFTSCLWHVIQGPRLHPKLGLNPLSFA